MDRLCRVTALLLTALSLCAADFRSGQAARAVIGQSSFSSREANITPTALAIVDNRLYAADASRRVLTYDLTQIPGVKDELAAAGGETCALCGFAPVASTPQSVFPGIASVSGFGKTVVIADAAKHRVLIWRDTAAPRSGRGPDVILDGSSAEATAFAGTVPVDPISVAFDGKHLFVGDAALQRILVWNSLPASSAQPADAILGEPAGNPNEGSLPGPDTISRPSALASDGTNLYAADAVSHRILIFTAGDIALGQAAVVNSASLAAGPLAPGTLITISGRNLSEAEDAAPDATEQTLPLELAGTEVLLDGRRLPLLSVSPDEVRAQLPYDMENIAAASLYVRTRHHDGSVLVTNAVGLELLPTDPGVFALGGAEPRSGMVLHIDALSGESGAPVTADDPAIPGEVLGLWTTGLGSVDGDAENAVVAGLPNGGPDAVVLNPVEAFAAGRAAQVISAALPHGSIGIYEVRIQLPADLESDPRTPLLLSQNGEFSNTVTIAVRRTVH